MNEPPHIRVGDRVWIQQQEEETGSSRGFIYSGMGIVLGPSRLLTDAGKFALYVWVAQPIWDDRQEVRHTTYVPMKGYQKPWEPCWCPWDEAERPEIDWTE